MSILRLLLVVALSFAAHASAQTPRATLDPAQQSQRESLIESGLSLRSRARDEEALRAFQRAAQIQRDGRVVAQIAFAEQAMGRWGESYRHLKEALEDRDDPWIQEHAAALETELAHIEANTGRLEVITNVAVTKLTIDGVEVGTTPLSEPLVITAGAVVISAQAPGYITTTRRVPVHAGALSRAELTLVPEPAVVRSTVMIDRVETRHERRTEWLYVAGAGALVSVASVGPWLRGEHIKDDLEQNCSAPGTCEGSFARDRDKVERLDRATNGLLFGGIATAAIAGTMYWLWPRAEQRVQPTALITPQSFVLAARVTR